MLKKLLSVAAAVLIAAALPACSYAPAEAEPPTPSPISGSDEPPGEVVLEWDRPSERISGSELPAEEIAGYRIYYGTAPQSYERVIELDADASLPYRVSGLEAGERYYFAITAVDQEGRESPRSNPVALTAETPETLQATAER